VDADKRARVFGMTRAQLTLLLRLERNPGLTQKEVADLLEVEPISVARLVDRLEASDLVKRCPDASDRRVWRLHLRPSAAELLSKIKVLRTELQEMVGRGLDEEMRETMVTGLLKMKSNLLRPQLLQPVEAMASLPAEPALAPSAEPALASSAEPAMPLQESV
jgi:DNA-binding MarR family transcriptional regulator